jgi:hypothetical protein
MSLISKAFQPDSILAMDTSRFGPNFGGRVDVAS